MVDSVASYIQRMLESKLPRNLPVLTVCAKGDTFAFAAHALRRLRYRQSCRRHEGEGEAEFVRYLLENLPEVNEDYLIIKRVNAGLKVATEDDAWTLELGKNVCGLSAAPQR
jgi:hypothetical protein